MIDTTLIRVEFVAFLVYLGWAAAAAAQSPAQPVSWSVSASAGTVAKPGTHLTLNLAAQVEDGWHVYGLNQADGGPTALRITVDPDGIVQSAGTPSGTPPMKKHDASFDLDTEVFVHPFTLHVPVQVKPHAAAGSQDIALNVRFQACNDHVCLPPRTVHLTVPVQIPAGAR
jgi:DsbC/DsbD-like thiol-disulfide interchange protein